MPLGPHLFARGPSVQPQRITDLHGACILPNLLRTCDLIPEDKLAEHPTGATDVPAGKPQSGDRTASTKEQLLFPRHEVNTTLFFKFFFLFL